LGIVSDQSLIGSGVASLRGKNAQIVGERVKLGRTLLATN